MYIAPNTTIHLLSGVPLDPSYDDTVYFYSKKAQSDALYAYKKKSFDEQTYTRVGKGKIRLQVLADEIYDCNYLMFKNRSFGDKWFYAFITAIDYINNSTSEITFDIDVMQTWFFDYELEDCFVEREHSATDEPGDSLTAEPVATGPIIAHSIDASGFFEDWAVVIGKAQTGGG